jgi:myxalamid-type nonribosomal peptide synthetase MxaA
MCKPSRDGLERAACIATAAPLDRGTEPETRGQPIPLSCAQERLWFLDQLGLARSAYNMPLALRLDGALDVPALERSLTGLVERHESLRTRFGVERGVPHQVIDPPGPFKLELLDLSGATDAERDSLLRDCMKREQLYRFDLLNGPLVRAVLVTVQPAEHLLLLTMHHIVSDGWSLGILQRELQALYCAFSQRQPAALAPLGLRYVEWAMLQREQLAEVARTHLTYWKERLRGAPSQLELPTDHARPVVESFKGGEVRFGLSPLLSSALRDLARREGVTLFMLSLAAYQLLLFRLSAQQDIVVGVPVAGRSDSSAHGTVGCFLNTVVFRTRLAGNPTFRELLARVKETSLDAYAHQELPFEVLVKELRPDRDLGRQHIFQVMLAVQGHPEQRSQTPGLTWTWIDVERVSAHFDLTLYVYDAPSELSGRFEYAADLFDRPTIERMAAHLRVLLAAVVADPDAHIDDVPIMSAAERERIVRGFNETTTPYPADRLVHELFEERVASAPHSLAVLCDGQALDYAALNAMANRLARHLRELGVGVGEYVPIVMPRSLQMLVAQIAVLKCGAAYVPMDPTLPAERLAFCIRDCAARYVVTIQGAQAAVADPVVQWVDCSSVAPHLDDYPVDNLDVQVERPHPAYVMYTSGSTGIPKGVVVPHHAIGRLVINPNYIEIEPQDRFCYASNPAFDAATFEVWGALLNGASVVIVPPEVVLEAPRFAELLRQSGVTVLWLTIGLLAQYSRPLAPVFPRLRYLLTGGDVVDAGLAAKILQQAPPRHFICAYGPTECTTFSTAHLIEGIDEAAKSVPIGRPISNTQVYILDTSLQPVPIGVAGEIYIGGPGVALGYLNRPDLTAQRFIPDPFSVHCAARLYRTGDLARWRADGTVEFLGRNDQQVKIRGFRVELGEVEATLARHAQVHEVVVVARQGGPAGKLLVAYVTKHGEHAPAPEELRMYLESSLPEYMVPTAFVVLERFPLTVNGKVDRRALPAPGADAFTHQQYEAPRGEVEERLAQIWRALLPVQRIGRRDDFFGLGGHSLLVLQALFKINQSFGCKLAVADLYRSPTLHELADRIRGSVVADELIDLAREAALDHAILARAEPVHVPARAVLLTGSTGFVGRFLLWQLLKETQATIYCLVRASSAHQAMRRLRATLIAWDLWRDELAPRIVAIPGDLRQPRLGIDQFDYQMLTRTIDTIFHCATSMNHLESYLAAKAANVESARELLRFATAHKAKSVNYVSTLSVFRSRQTGSGRVVDERTPIEREQHPVSSGYAGSKWVAEKIFMTAGERGIPCNIFRLGLVWADAEQGRYDELQREYRIIKSCLLSGFGIKDYRCAAAPTPVDYVAQAMVLLGNRHMQGSGIFHLCAPAQLIDGVFERCNEFVGTSLELLSHYEWICEMKRLHEHGTSLPVVPLIEYAFSMSEQSFIEHQRRMQEHRARVDSSRTQVELEQLGIVAPIVDDMLLRTCVQSMCMRDEALRARISLHGVGIDHRPTGAESASSFREGCS